MNIFLGVLALLFAATSALLGWLVLEGRKRLEDRRVSVAELKADLQAAYGQMDMMGDTHDELLDLAGDLREQRREEAQNYEDRAMRYEEVIMKKHDRIDELLRQNQNLAERVASLRQAGLSEGGDDFHVEDVEPEEPYSPDLQRFYEGLRDEAQQWAETFIETRRAAGMEDEQILDELERAGSIG